VVVVLAVVEVDGGNVVVVLVVLVVVVLAVVEVDGGNVVVVVDDEVDVGSVVDVVVVRATAVLSSVALPIATPMPAPANSNTTAMPHTLAGLMLTPSP